jgi:glycosyltransferase involved in cell wall biosynthesis
MRALWLVRPNLTSRPGGDTTQILRTQEALHQLGVEVTLCSDSEPDYAGYDLVHLFHLDRVWENMRWVGPIRANGVACVLSPIYWPAQEYDRLGRRGFQGTLSRQLGSMRYAGLRSFQHALLASWNQKDPSRLQPGVLRFEACVRKILKSVDLILPNSLSEQFQIEQYFGDEAACTVIPNAVDISTFRPQHEHCDRNANKVISVGRIEPRKNQLSLIRALSGTPIQLSIVGQPSRFGHRYARQCYREAGPNVTFHHWQSSASLARHYRQARVHACTSWYETPGLASLEAASSGCHVVATDRGATREYFGDHVDYCSPEDPRSIRGAVEKALVRESSHELRDTIAQFMTWQQAAKKTVDAYESVIR